MGVRFPQSRPREDPSAIRTCGQARGKPRKGRVWVGGPAEGPRTRTSPVAEGFPSRDDRAM